jgi:putative spermidine/putrescine transport system permease protein
MYQIFTAFSQTIYKILFQIIIFFLSLFIIAPILTVILYSLSPETRFIFPPPDLSIKWYLNLLNYSDFKWSFLLSISIVAYVIPISALISIPAAFAFVRSKFPGKSILNLLFLSPLMLPTLIFGLALLQIYSIHGLFDTRTGVILAHITITIPYFIRSVMASLYGFDNSLEEAASILGAGPLRIFFYVTLPLIKPGIIAGCVFSFIISFDEFTTTFFITGQNTITLPVRIYNYIQTENDPTVAALSTIMICISFAIIFIANKIVGLEKIVITN